MAVSKKTRRIQMLALGGVLLTASAILIALAFDDTITFFKSPTELSEGNFRADQRLRVGGLVVEGTVNRGTGTEVSFDLTDGNGVVTVAFNGVLPDLFREGQGIIAEGFWQSGQFEAVEVLAKHDENYMPKEVADALKEQGHWQPEGPGS